MRKRKLKIQNIFITASIVFILTCILVYGGRFIYFYLDSKKITSKKTFAYTVKANNMKNENFKVIKTSYYFMNDANTNYVSYSGLLFRIVKIDSAEHIYLLSENAVTSLAPGLNRSFDTSYINEWLNTKLDKNINTSYLENAKVCLDTKDKISNEECKKETEEYKIALLSLEDYINTGSSKSFVNTGESFYLTDSTKEKETWYADMQKGVSKSDGADILGVKPLLVLKSDILLEDGDGTKEHPYELKEKIELGGYVKLGKDMWRIYEVEDEYYKLSLNTALKEQRNYANNSYKYNVNATNTLAYYLNHTYLNSLSYKNNIVSSTYYDGYYSLENNYDYNKKQSMKVKVGILSIGDIFLSTSKNYALATGVNKSGSLLYVVNNNGTLTAEDVSSKINIIPCITIKKDILTTGSGKENDPYEVGDKNA